MKTFMNVFGLVLTITFGGLTQAAELEDMGLTKVKDSRSRISYIMADHNFDHYDSIAIADIVADEVKINQSSTSIMRRADWEMDEKRQQRVTDMHRKAFERELAETQGLKLVDQVGENTLVLITRLKEVSPSVNYDPQQQSGRTRVYSNGSGSAVIEMFLVDGQSGEVVAVAVVARQLGHFVHINNSVTNGSDVQTAFNAWAKQARGTIEQLPAMASNARS